MPRTFFTARDVQEMQAMARTTYLVTITVYRLKGDRTTSGGTKSKFPDDWNAVAQGVICHIALDNRRQREAQVGGQNQPVSYYELFSETGLDVDSSCKLKVTASQFNPTLLGLVMDVTAVPKDTWGIKQRIEAVSRQG
jgi:Family of unknown function (DUF6093)